MFDFGDALDSKEQSKIRGIVNKLLADIENDLEELSPKDKVSLLSKLLPYIESKQ